MAGRKRNDPAPRNTHVIQICVPEDDYYSIHQKAQKTEHKTASVWLRHYLREQGVLTSA